MTETIPGHEVNFIIKEITPSNNVLLRMHWRKRAKLNKDWHNMVLIQKGGYERFHQMSFLPAKTKRKITIRSYRQNKVDRDNLIGGMKPLIDALVNNSFIVDDSPDWVELDIHSEIDRKDKHTEISICCIGVGEVTSS